MWVWLNRWYEAEGKTRYEGAEETEKAFLEKSSTLAVMDLACGT